MPDPSLPEPTMPEGPVDMRLVALDMDGTLLDDAKRIPEEFWALATRLAEAGIAVVPASGRQYATLRRQFGDVGESMGYIAENGTLVAYRGEILATDTLGPDVVRDLVRSVRRAVEEGRNVGTVVCGVNSAYIERTDPPFRAEADTYYAQLTEVEDLTAVEDGVLKVAIFDFDDIESGTLPYVIGYRDTHQVVVSGQHWIDVMNPGVHKGEGLKRLREKLGIERDQCVAFGDYLNDAELLDEAGHSFAMANAHQDLLTRARYVAPANTEHGVITVLENLLSRLPLETPAGAETHPG